MTLEWHLQFDHSLQSVGKWTVTTDNYNLYSMDVGGLICEKRFPAPLCDSNIAGDWTVVSVVSSEKGSPLGWRAEFNLESIRWFDAEKGSSLMDPGSLKLLMQPSSHPHSPLSHRIALSSFAGGNTVLRSSAKHVSKNLVATAQNSELDHLQLCQFRHLRMRV